HAHPEFSSPETTNPLDAVIWDQAGDRIAQQAADHVASAQDGARLLLYKNNTDSKSVSYGAHENYLVARQLDFDELTEFILGFFTTRQIITGAGRVGIGSRMSVPDFRSRNEPISLKKRSGLKLRSGVLSLMLAMSHMPGPMPIVDYMSSSETPTCRNTQHGCGWE